MNLVITRCENPCLYGDSHSVRYAVISSGFPRTKSNYLILNVFNLEISRKYRVGECLTWRFCCGLLSSWYDLPVCMIFIPSQVFLVLYYPHYSWGEEVVERKQREIFVAILGAFTKLRRGAFTFLMPVSQSVCAPTWHVSSPIGRIFMKLDIGVFFENMSRNSIFIKIRQEQRVLYMKTNTLFKIKSRSFLRRVRNVSEQICRENQNIKFIFLY
jgi:hypothetical protein